MRVLLRSWLPVLAAALGALLAAGCAAPAATEAQHPYEVRGIDISAHNGEIDFRRVAEAGIEFVIIKATEGGNFKDKAFLSNVRRAREAGLKVGAYHFFRFDTPGYMQGLNFVNSIQGRHLDLPVVIDIEEWANPTSQPTPKVMGRLGEMIDHLESHGYRVMLYTNKNGYERFVRGRLEGYPLWICSLAQEPEGMEWTLWQSTHNGRVDGVDHPVDINHFRGSREMWERFVFSN